jgi:hypothetical protein
VWDKWLIIMSKRSKLKNYDRRGVFIDLDEPNVAITGGGGGGVGLLGSTPSKWVQLPVHMSQTFVGEVSPNSPVHHTRQHAREEPC